MTGSDDKATILILARDVLGGGLLGALVEAEGSTPCYAFDGERPELAVERLRPTMVLVDAYHAAARTDAFFAAARARDVRVVLFAPSVPWHEMQEVAERWGVRIIHPRDGGSLGRLIRGAIRDPD